MAAKPKQPTPEEQRKLSEMRDKLEKSGKVQKHQPRHEKPKGK
jgi:hypothetical protein